MRRVVSLLFLSLLGAVCAAAQTPGGNSNANTGGSPSGESLRAAMRAGDPARGGEALISASRAYNAKFEDEADAARRAVPRTFNAEVVVTNGAAQAIRSVSWTATLINRDTGAVIRSYDVTTRTRIAPGKTRKLSKFLQTPRDNVVKVASQPPGKPTVADLKVRITGVTYADGTTSTTP